MAWAPDSSISAEAVESLLNSFAMLFVVVCYVSSEAKFFRIINIQLSAFCYMAVRLIIFMPERWLFGRGRSRLFIENIIGIHYNGLAFFLTLGIILAAFLYLKTKSRFAMVLIPFFLYVIFLGGSRQGVIISVAGLLAMYALRKGIKQIYKTVITLAAIIIVFLFYINSDLPGAERILSLINGFFGGTAETSFNERALFRKWATAEFLQRPFFGWGVSSFKYYLISINYFRIHNHSHNTYTELLFCLGITGFVMYYSIYLRILIQAVKNLSAENLYAILSIIIIFVMLVFGYGEVLFYQARGPTAALALFYAFYALKLYNEQPKERTNQ
jgi:O-antigen ligase